MKGQWRKTLGGTDKGNAFPRSDTAKLLKNVEECKARLIKIEIPLSAVSRQSSTYWKNVLIALQLSILLCVLLVLSLFGMSLLKDRPRSESQLTYLNDQEQTSIEFKSQLSFIEEQLRQHLLDQLRRALFKPSSLTSTTTTTTTTSTTTSAPYTRQVQLENIAALMARRLEPIVGHHEELLVWYYLHREEPNFLSREDKLKVHVAKLLFDSNIEDFNRDATIVLDLMIDDTYREDFRRLTDPDEGSFQPENKYQRYIVDRLMMKWRYNKQFEERSQSADMLAKAIETRNKLELWMLQPEDLEAIFEASSPKPDNWNKRRHIVFTD